MRLFKFSLVVVCLLFSCWVHPQGATAKDHFLTIGGGYSPSGNQISLEKNILFFQRLLTEKKQAGAPHDIYFADGKSPNRDLQYSDPNLKIPKVNTLMARVFLKESGLRYLYRDHQLGNIQGGSNRANIKRWFETKGNKLTKGDRLFVYVTAHGGRGDRKTPHNTKLYLWNQKYLRMSEFVSYLDKVPNDVQVVVVMVQCYAGGYANIIFNQGDSKKGFTKANRCGFYATVHNRVAAGCTPDINEENYQEYSTHFWAAILGKTRTGKTIKSPDYNHDGIVSLDEAHAYALITSDTIDISIKTSDAFLRAYSKTKVKGKPSLLTADSPYDQLFKLATTSQQAVLSNLTKELKFDTKNRAKEARSLASKIYKEKKSLLSKQKSNQALYKKTIGNIRNTLLQRWPEMKNPYSPKAISYITDEAKEVVSTIESHSDYKKMTQLYQWLTKSSKQKLDLDRRWVKCQRVIRCLEDIALATNLPQVANQQTQQRYQQLLRAESQTFDSISDKSLPLTGK